jgi:hypothetical protein
LNAALSRRPPGEFRACDFGYISPNNLFNWLRNSLQSVDVHVMFFGTARRSQETIRKAMAHDCSRKAGAAALTPREQP